jgi:UDP-GlcNAc:undecaprenyl-phosphate/decaprenyl-phosphate GlcNAc-1-phosphate transferase
VTVVVPLVALAVSALVVWLALRTPAVRARFTAEPRDDRWHTDATPAIGGIGIFAGFATALALAIAAGTFASTNEIAAVLAGCAILFTTGLVDDVRSLHPLVKLAGQVVAAVLVLTSGVSVEVLGNDTLAFALGLVWLVGMTNALNLLDNMDGLAASLTVVSAGFFAVAAAWVNPNADVAIVAAALAAAAAGFLPFNLRPRGPALAFMGDSGSQLLGFTLAALGLMASYKVASTTIATLVLPLLVLAVPIMDTGLVTLLRLLEGRPVTQGGRDHTSHRLVLRGLSEKRTVLLLVAVATALGATSLAYLVLDSGRITTAGVLVTFALLLQFATVLSGPLEAEASDAAGVAGSPLTSPWALRIRRLSEVIVDGALVTAAFYCAYLIIIEGDGTENQRHIFIVTLPIVLFARYATFIPFGLYRSVWRYAGARDAALVVSAVAVSEVIAFAVADALHAFGDFPGTIFVVDALLCAGLVGAARFGERGFVSFIESLRNHGGKRRTLIVGAGREGRSLLRELRETPGERVVGFVDDDPRLRGRRLQGVPVVGRLEQLPEVLARVTPDSVLVTMGHAAPEVLAAVVDACAAAHVDLRFVRRELVPAPVVAARVGIE